MEVVELFTKGGPVMYLLLMCSLAVATIGIERLRYYSYAMDRSERFLVALKERLKSQKSQDVLDFFSNNRSSLGLIVRAGLKAAVDGYDVEPAMNVAYNKEAMKLRARLNYLSMIVTLAPLLGLLGTIFGMIESFNIFSIQSGQPLAITSGIGEALVATAMGLCVAIFALIVHTYLAQKLDESLTTLDQGIDIVLTALNKKSDPNKISAAEAEGRERYLYE